LHISDDRQLLEVRAIREIKNTKYLLAGLVSLITLLVYLPSLWNDFLWDDEVYVTDNIIIRSFNLDLIKSVFFEFHASNWHPLTWISHAIDYAIWGLNPIGHHLTNVVLHSVIAALVVVITVQLVDLYGKRTAVAEVAPWLKGTGILITAGVTGLLFGLHPIHVESVAWVAERKDLLCALFFLLSIMTYVKYARAVSNNAAPLFPLRYKHYLITFGFFTLALLSKPMAVSLPAVMLILDWYPLRRIQSLKSFRVSLVEKAPFIILSLLSSIVTIQAQKIAIELMQVVPLSTRVLVAVKSLIGYLWKIILPTNLIPYYPYPKDISLLSLPYPLTIVLTVGITVICIVKARKQRLWSSLWAYYVVTLIPVIGIIQVGSQSMADRYTYLPSLGPFLMMGLVIAWSWNWVNTLRGKKAIVKLLGLSVFIFLTTALMYLTVGQIGIWKDDITLWSYVIEKEPESVPQAYYNRGLDFGNMGRFDKAIGDYDKAISLNPSYTEAYYNRGLVYSNMGRFDKAISDFQKVCDFGDRDGCKLLQTLTKR